MATKESGFDKLARLIKQESEDIRSELNSLERKLDSGFAEVDHQLHSIRAELKSERIDVDELRAKVLKE